MSTLSEILNHPDMRTALLAAGWLPPERVKEVNDLMNRLNSGLVSAMHNSPSKGVRVSVALCGAALRTLHGNAQGLIPHKVAQAALTREAKKKAKKECREASIRTKCGETQ